MNKQLLTGTLRLLACATAGIIAGLLIAWSEAEPNPFIRLVLCLAAPTLAITVWVACAAGQDNRDDAARNHPSTCVSRRASHTTTIQKGN